MNIRPQRLLPAFAILLVLSGLAVTQDAPPKARVEGRVANTAGLPLNRATVALVGNNRTPAGLMPPAYRTTSRAGGGFVFEDVEPNTYRIFVQHAGYLDFVYLQADGRVAVPLAAGDRKTIDIKMTAPSFLSGRVTNEEGEPFPDARVNVLRVSRAGSRKQLTALAPVSAGADGSFTIGRLTAGRYYLAASNPPSLTDTNQREVRQGKTEDVRFVTTYYPSTIDTAGATLIDLHAETDLHNMDIRLRRARVFHIAGKVIQPPGSTMANPSIVLLRPGMTDMSDPQGNANRVFANEGVFQVNGLLPGAYAFQAWEGASRQLQGHLSVILSDHDIDDAVLTLVQALEIPLSVRIEDADAQQTQTIARALGRFTLTASDGVNSNAMAQSKDDGTWIFHNIGLGSYRVGLGGPDGTYVKSIRFGDQDITRSELDTTSGGGPLVLTLSAHAAEVHGTVNDSHGQALSGVTVTLWTAGMPPPGTLDQARSTLTDADGNFRFGNLPPGEYRVAAWEKVDPGLPNAAEFHSKFDGDAAVVKLSENSRETVQPPLISRQRVEAAAAVLPQ